MADSYNHVVAGNKRLLNIANMARSLENAGDVYEAVEEMYGMIWWLAEGDPDRVEQARLHYLAGLSRSPGKQKEN